MQVEQKKRILKRISLLQSEIDELEEVVMKLSSNPFLSASMSSGVGSKSYSYKDVSKLQETILRKNIQINNLRAKLGGIAATMPIKIVLTYF